MPKTSPYYSIQSEDSEPVYHDDLECEFGNAIDDRFFASGTGDRPLCKRCERLAREVDDTAIVVRATVTAPSHS